MDFLYELSHTYTAAPFSFFVHDDLLADSHWSPSPKRCDRGTQGQGSCSSMACRETTGGQRRAANTGLVQDSGNVGGPRHTGIDEVFFYCTEELGSESTSRAAHVEFMASTNTTSATYSSHSFTAPFSYGVTTRRTVIPPASKDCHDRPQSCSFDLCPPTASASNYRPRRRVECAIDGTPTFPPPLSSLLCDRPLMRSFKQGGRFVLKKVTNASQSLFRATRKDGRLRLDVLSSSAEDGVDDQCFPNPVNNIRPQHWPYRPRSPLGWSSHMLSCKPISYKSLPPQALAMLINSKGTCSSIVQQPKEAHFIPTHNLQCPTRTQAAPVPVLMPRVFALLSFLPVGLGLIIIELGQSKHGEYYGTLSGVYFMKSMSLQSCSKVRGIHLLTNLYGMDGKLPRRELCRIDSCMKPRIFA